jgi:hypothetical protein
LFVYATRRDGEFRGFIHRQLVIDPKRSGAALARGGIKYYGHLELESGEYLVRALVRENDGGRMGLAVTPLSVPSFVAGATTLLTPFFLDDPGRWALVRERTDSASDGTVIYPFTLQGEPYVPQAAARLRAGVRSRVCLIGYSVADGVEIEATWLTAAGEIPARFSSERQAMAIEGQSQWVAEVEADGVPAGEQRLRISVVERVSRRTLAVAERLVRVEG